MVKQSRYISKLESEKVNKSSAFKCAWCGVYLTEKHHIKKFSEGGSNDSSNLILLCSNCHTLAHSGKISESDLRDRRVELSGEVDRSSANFSVGDTRGIVIGGNIFPDTPNIINHNGENIIVAKIENGNLLISLRLYDLNGYLICWMEDNKWWVENQKVIDFSYTKSKLIIIGKDDIHISFDINNDKKEIIICGILYLNGIKLTFDRDKIKFGNSVFLGNLFHCCDCAFRFDTEIQDC
jgi:hypothetical protein